MQAQRKQQGILGRTALRLFASFAVGCLGGTAVPPAKNLFAVILCAVLCFALLSFFCRGGKNRMLCPAVLLGALFFYGAISLGGEFSTPLYALYTALLGTEQKPPEKEYLDAVAPLVKKEVARVNAMFPSYKAMTRIVLRTENFVRTTTQKIKRKEAENYREEYIV